MGTAPCLGTKRKIRRNVLVFALRVSLRGADAVCGHRAGLRGSPVPMPCLHLFPEDLSARLALPSPAVDRFQTRSVKAIRLYQSYRVLSGIIFRRKTASRPLRDGGPSLVLQLREEMASSSGRELFLPVAKISAVAWPFVSRRRLWRARRRTERAEASLVSGHG